jgi:hypothetical protein
MDIPLLSNGERLKYMNRRSPFFVFALCSFLMLWASLLQAQDKVQLEHCDVLPIIPVRIDGPPMRFLLDTGATTILNINSFSQGRSKEIQISSWTGSAATSAREVFIPELKVGDHSLHNVRLPAVDLSPIGKACGGQIDGLLGVDLLEKMGATIDLKRRVAQFSHFKDPSAEERLAAHSAATSRCLSAFNNGRAEALADCFDPEIVLYTPWGEFRGRDQVIEYLKGRFLSQEPRPKFQFRMHESRVVGEAVWQSYDYRVESSNLHITGRGMMVSRENNGHWQLLNMHNSMVQPTADR